MRMFAALITAVLSVPAAPVPPAPSPSTAGATTWSVAPAGAKGPDGRPALVYKLDPGAKLTDHVAVTNHSRRPLTLRLYAGDAFTTAGGGFDLLAAGSKPVDAGAWVTPARGTVAVPAGSRVLVPVTIAVPANATPGDHTGGVVASLTTGAADSAGNSVSVDHRVGTRIYLRVTGPLRPALGVGAVEVTRRTSWNPLRLPEITAAFTVTNTGNLRLAGQPSVRTEGPFGLGGRGSEGAALPQILPGNAVRTTVTSRGVLPLGRVTVETAVRPRAVDGQVVDPAPAVAVARTSIWLIPWPQLIALGLAALLVAGWSGLRRRNRRRLHAALAAAEQRGRERGRSTTDTSEGPPSETEEEQP